MNVYEKFTANYPRNDADEFFCVDSEKKFKGCLDRNLNFITDMQLRDVDMWKLFVEQFRIKSDNINGGWRGEFWGKMMRGACFVCGYLKDEELFNILKKSVEDMMNEQDSFGRISTYAIEHEFDAWDLWGRKYVLLGMQYFIEISQDAEFNKKVIDCMSKQVEYLISKIGEPEDGKKLITKLTRHWRGLNSSSILEPVVRLYSITGNQKFLDFATYIVNCGFTDVSNIYNLSYKNELHIYQYPVTKAYEMTSCFMGLLEYYRITKNEKHLKAIINFADQILEDEFTVIGSAGCTHELFDHSKVRQANPKSEDEPLGQETCVTVTLMQFFNQLNLITGDSRYMDAFEKSLYNGYLGAINTDKSVSHNLEKTHPECKKVPLPFDSYSPLTAGTRGNGIGGFMQFQNGRFYGCCVCIGAAGIGMAMKSSVISKQNGIVVNLFEEGRVVQPLLNGKKVNLNFDTAYPADGYIKITVDTDCTEEFEIMFRNPEWSINTELLVNGEKYDVSDGYMSVSRIWKNGDIIEINFDMRAKPIFPIPYGKQILMNNVIWGANYMVSTVDYEHPDAKNHIAIQRGPIMLAQENRLGYNIDDAVNVRVGEDGFVDVKILDSKTAPYDCLVQAEIPTNDGGYFLVTDYASAGKLWTQENKLAVWMKTMM